jgi:hypothetical protein
LATLRHWKTNIQLVPWFTLGVTLISLLLVSIAPTAVAVRSARWLAIAVIVCTVFGVYEHILGNYRVAPLDFRYTDRWPTMSKFSRWWAAANKTVGPSPPLAPAALAYSALCVLFATIRHPATRRSSENPVKTDR